MNTLIDVNILRVFIGEAAKHDGVPLADVIVGEAIKRGMAGAVVTRGVMGFGANSLLHTSKILRLSEDLPVVVQIVDTPSRIADFLPHVDAMVEEGTIVVEKGQAIFHMPMRIRDVMTGDVATVGPNAPLSEVGELLVRRQVKALPVVEGARVVGIVTGGDLLQRADMPLRLDIQCLLPPSVQAGHIQCLDKEGLQAKDVMTAPVHVLNIKTNVTDALTVMTKRKLKRLPVVDDDGNLMGIVSRADALRAIAKVSSVAEFLPELPSGLKRVAKDVMFKDVPTVLPETSLADVLQKIVATPLRRVVVVDKEGLIVGIILDSDLVGRYLNTDKFGLLHYLLNILSDKQRDFSKLSGTAKDVMEAPVFTVLPEASLTDVVQSMVARKAKRFVVADGKRHLLGMVDRENVVRALAEG